jgi:hypothetical protein
MGFSRAQLTDHAYRRREESPAHNIKSSREMNSIRVNIYIYLTCRTVTFVKISK